jgi:putative sterol carrier protein
MTPHNFPTHTEDFDVVLLKDGVSDLTASPSDFKRVLVTGQADPIAALMSDTAQVKGFRPLFALPPGVMSSAEIMANRRVMDNDTLDRTKI